MGEFGRFNVFKNCDSSDVPVPVPVIFFGKYEYKYIWVNQKWANMNIIIWIDVHEYKYKYEDHHTQKKRKIDMFMDIKTIKLCKFLQLWFIIKKKNIQTKYYLIYYS